MSASAKPQVTQDEAPAPAPAATVTAPPTAKKKHFKRFWWIYLLILLIVTVIAVVPSVLLAAVPQAAQKKLNEAKLSIDAIAITNTQTGSLLMTIDSTIEADSSVHATVDSFDGTLYLADSDPPLAFANITFPQTTSSSLQVVNVTQEISIQNLDALTSFNKALLSGQYVNVRVKGYTKIHVRGIPGAYPATFDKTVNLKGLNNLAGTSISDAVIDPLAAKGNFNATAHIPNPTILTLEIGNTTFTNYLDGEDIGQVYISNLILRPGTNAFSLTADIKQLPILNALTKEPYCELGGKLPFKLSGNNVVNDGQVIPYFRDALAANPMNVTVDLGDAAREQGIPVKCLSA